MIDLQGKSLEDFCKDYKMLQRQISFVQKECNRKCTQKDSPAFAILEKKTKERDKAKAIIEEFIKDLSELDGSLLRLFFLEDVKADDVAEMLSISVREFYRRKKRILTELEEKNKDALK